MKWVFVAVCSILLGCSHLRARSVRPAPIAAKPIPLEAQNQVKPSPVEAKATPWEVLDDAARAADKVVIQIEAWQTASRTADAAREAREAEAAWRLNEMMASLEGLAKP